MYPLGLQSVKRKKITATFGSNQGVREFILKAISEDADDREKEKRPELSGRMALLGGGSVLIFSF